MVTAKHRSIASGLNSIIRGWLNYFEIQGVSYPAMSKRKFRFYLSERIYRYYNRKSQRKCRLYGHNAFEVLTDQIWSDRPDKICIPTGSLVNA